ALKAISTGTTCFPSLISPRRWNEAYALVLSISRSSGPSERLEPPAQPAASRAMPKRRWPRFGSRIIGSYDKTAIGHCLPSLERTMSSVTPIVLAAGASRRMGRAKALLDFDGRACLDLV